MLEVSQSTFCDRSVGSTCTTPTKDQDLSQEVLGSVSLDLEMDDLIVSCPCPILIPNKLPRALTRRASGLLSLRPCLVSILLRDSLCVWLIVWGCTDREGNATKGVGQNTLFAPSSGISVYGHCDSVNGRTDRQTDRSIAG